MAIKSLYFIVCLSLFNMFLITSDGVMIKKECPRDEVHVACSFYGEYTCWETSNELMRVLARPERLRHCQTRCACRKGYVRAFPRGPCIPAPSCTSKELKTLLDKVPDDFYDF